MINYKWKNLFDDSSTKYNLVLTSDNIRIDYTDMTGAWELYEGLTDSAKFYLGQCLPSRFTIHIRNDGESYLGRQFDVNLVLNNHDDEPFGFGTFRVYEETLEDDRRKKKLTLYDPLYEIINADVTEWYNSLTFPMTIKNFRDSFFQQFGIEQANAGANDSVKINKKSIDGSLKGKEVIESICEIKGVFGNIGRDGKFKYYAPTLAVQKTFDSYRSLKYENYSVKKIDILNINFDGIPNVQYGSGGTNSYYIQHDLLLHGKPESELITMLTNMYSYAQRCVFTPCDIEMNAHPYVTIGDRITLTHRSGDIVETVIMNRTIRGVQSLTDKITNQGDEYRSDSKSIRQKVAETSQRVGAVEADNVNIHGSLSAQSGRIDDLNTKKLSTSDLSAEVAKLGYATIGELDAQKARIDQLNASKITADQVTAELIQSRFLNPNAGTLTMGNIRASTFQWFNGTDYVTLRFAADGTVRWK